MEVTRSNPESRGGRDEESKARREMEKDDDSGDRQVLASSCSTYLGKPTPTWLCPAKYNPLFFARSQEPKPSYKHECLDRHGMDV